MCMQAAEFMGCQELRSVIIEWLQVVLKEFVKWGRTIESVGVAADTLQSSCLRMCYYTKVRHSHGADIASIRLRWWLLHAPDGFPMKRNVIIPCCCQNPAKVAHKSCPTGQSVPNKAKRQNKPGVKTAWRIVYLCCTFVQQMRFSAPDF